jgi:hypothetical protein
VRRMLADSRSDGLISNFFGQWLQLRNLRNLAPDATVFPEFDQNLRDAMAQETDLFLKDQFHSDHSVVDLLRANYTFVNERLATHYGMPNIYGSHFRRVQLPGVSRMGLLGQASILTLTSYSNRTSPVTRGKWLLETFLNSPPPPPPPNVPQLPDRGGSGPALSMRDRMEEHRKNPACAVCHRIMDPLGFALENFDGIGKFRAAEVATIPGDAGSPIDSSGVFIDGSKFEGPSGLRHLLLERQDAFVTTVVEKLLTYSLGRRLEYYDMPAVRRIVRECADTDYRWSSIIVAIVKSAPFEMKGAAS